MGRKITNEILNNIKRNFMRLVQIKKNAEKCENE